MAGTQIPGEPVGIPYVAGISNPGKLDNFTTNITFALTIAVATNVVIVESIIGATVGDSIDISLDDGAVITRTISALATSTQITVSEQIQVNAAIGNRVLIYSVLTSNFDSSTLGSNQQIGHVEQLLICDRTGFKISVKEGLKEEWNGRKVRKKSFEPRHPQDFLRSNSEDEQNGSPRPEQADQDVADLYPVGVKASDL